MLFRFYSSLSYILTLRKFCCDSLYSTTKTNKFHHFMMFLIPFNSYTLMFCVTGCKLCSGKKKREKRKMLKNIQHENMKNTREKFWDTLISTLYCNLLLHFIPFHTHAHLIFSPFFWGLCTEHRMKSFPSFLYSVMSEADWAYDYANKMVKNISLKMCIYH